MTSKCHISIRVCFTYRIYPVLNFRLCLPEGQRHAGSRYLVLAEFGPVHLLFVSTDGEPRHGQLLLMLLMLLMGRLLVLRVLSAGRPLHLGFICRREGTDDDIHTGGGADVTACSMGTSVNVSPTTDQTTDQTTDGRRTLSVSPEQSWLLAHFFRSSTESRPVSEGFLLVRPQPAVMLPRRLNARITIGELGTLFGLPERRVCRDGRATGSARGGHVRWSSESA